MTQDTNAEHEPRVYERPTIEDIGSLVGLTASKFQSIADYQAGADPNTTDPGS